MEKKEVKEELLGMVNSRPYKLDRAIQTEAGLTTAQIEDILENHRYLLKRLGEHYRSRRHALPEGIEKELTTNGAH